MDSQEPEALIRVTVKGRSHACLIRVRLVYIANFRPARALRGVLALKNKKKEKEKESQPDLDSLPLRLSSQLIKNNPHKPGSGGTLAFNPSTQEQRQVDL